jgi:hypothetical protein
MTIHCNCHGTGHAGVMMNLTKIEIWSDPNNPQVELTFRCPECGHEMTDHHFRMPGTPAIEMIQH